MTATTTGFRHDPHKSVPRSSWPSPPRLLGEYCTHLSFMLGSLSIVMFWMFGFGILLGAGAIAGRNRRLPAPRRRRERAQGTGSAPRHPHRGFRNRRRPRLPRRGSSQPLTYMPAPEVDTQ